MWLFMKSEMRVFEVLAVLPYLDGGVQDITLATAYPAAYKLVWFGLLATLPLL